MRLLTILTSVVFLSACAPKVVDKAFWIHTDTLHECSIKQDYDVNNPPTIREVLIEYGTAVNNNRAANQTLNAFREANKKIKTK